MKCRATGFFIKYSKQNFTFSNRGSPVEISSSTCMLRIHFWVKSITSKYILLYNLYKIHFIWSPGKIPSTLNKSLNRKTLYKGSCKYWQIKLHRISGVTALHTRTEPFQTTAGDKVQTVRAVSALVLTSGAGAAATQHFKEEGTFLQWQNQSIDMCHRARCHVNPLLFL